MVEAKKISNVSSFFSGKKKKKKKKKSARSNGSLSGKDQTRNSKSTPVHLPEQPPITPPPSSPSTTPRQSNKSLKGYNLVRQERSKQQQQHIESDGSSEYRRSPVERQRSPSLSSYLSRTNAVLEEEAATITTTGSTSRGSLDEEDKNATNGDRHSEEDDSLQEEDEEEHDFCEYSESSHDPYVYSDDSASLSDSYFHPQTDEDYVMGHRYHYLHYLYSNTRGGNNSNGYGDHSQQGPAASNYHRNGTATSNAATSSTHPLARNYGSLNSSGIGDSGSSPPLWLTGSIQEDSQFDTFSPVSSTTLSSTNTEGDQSLMKDSGETLPLLRGGAAMVDPQLPLVDDRTASGSDSKINGKKQRQKNGGKRKHRRRRRTGEVAANATMKGTKKHPKHRRHYQQQQRMPLLERHKREAAVKKVRGKAQEVTTWQDPIFAVLFLVQLLVVLLCALRFSLGTVEFKEDGRMSSTGFRHRLSRVESRDAISVALNSTSNVREGSTAWSEHSLNFENSTETPQEISQSRNHSLEYDQPETDPSLSTSKYNYSAPSLHGTHTIEDDANNNWFTIDYQNVIALMGISGFYSCFLAYLSFGFMLILARALIHITLVFSVVLSLASCLIGLVLDPHGIISVMGFGALLLALCYTSYNWSRIPFAATNLYTALQAMRCTADIAILGLASLVTAFGWCLLWSIAFIGVVDSINSCYANGNAYCMSHVTYVSTHIFFLLSFYWTNMVIKNVTRVTVASAIGTWWFQPSGIHGPFCSTAVSRPLLRSLTKSLGSICLGSLVLLPGQFISVLVEYFCCCCRVDALFPRQIDKSNNKAGNRSYHNKPSNLTAVTRGPGSGSKLTTTDATKEETFNDGKTANDAVAYKDVESCLSAMNAKDEIGSISTAPAGIAACYQKVSVFVGNLYYCVRSCNRWSFTYMGMYGYSFQEAGKRAIQLFETREWMEIVRDNLIQHVLMITSIIIGGSAGTFAVIVEETDGFEFTSFHKPIATAFIIGSVMGFVLSNILLHGVVGSAVNTILVCFAAGPFEFDRNHPRLSREMREVWSQEVWEPSE